MESFHEPTLIAALDRAESIIANPNQYRAHIRRNAMNALYRAAMPITTTNPLDDELDRLKTKLERLWDMPDRGKAISAWDTTLARYERMCGYQERMLIVMRKDRTT